MALVLCFPCFLWLFVSFGRLYMPASSSDYLFPLHSSAQLIMAQFPSLSSSKRKVMLKFWLWWYLLCLLSSRRGWLDIHFLTVRSTSKHLPLLAFCFLKTALWPHNFFYVSLLRLPPYFQIWVKIPSDNLGAILKYWIEIVSLWQWNENATHSDTDLRSFWTCDMVFITSCFRF